METVSFEDAGLVTPDVCLDLDAQYVVYEPRFYTEKELSEEGVVGLTVLVKHTKTNEVFIVRGDFVSGSGLDPWGMSTITMLVSGAQKLIGLDEDGDPDLQRVRLMKKVTLTVSDCNVLAMVTSLATDYQESQEQVNKFIKSIFKKD